MKQLLPMPKSMYQNFIERQFRIKQIKRLLRKARQKGIVVCPKK